MANDHYPACVEEVVCDIRYRKGTICAVRHFSESRPWRGSHSERKVKFERLLVELSELYAVPCPRLVTDGRDDGDSGRSCYVPRLNTIILRGKLSVVTLLHEFAHALYGSSERTACRWSLNLF